MKVYLAGPILGCNEGEAHDWRIAVASRLRVHNILGISPLRCEPLRTARYGFGNNDDPLFGTAKAIASKNQMDVRLCEATLAFLPRNWTGLPEWHQSYGTMQELAWAHAWGKITVTVSDDPDVFKHPVIGVSSGWMLRTLNEATELLIGLLGGYTGGKNV